MLQVVEPHLNGPGGDVPAIIHSAERDEVRRHLRPGPGARARRRSTRFAELGLDLIPGTGPLAAVVPGAFDAWMLMLRDYGTWELADVMEPAIGYARDGYPLVPRIRAAIGGVEDLLREEWTSSAEIYLPGCRGAGERFRNPALAGDLRADRGRARAAATREGRIDAARDAFYRGWVAEAIDGWVRETEVMDSSGERHRGLLSGDDLAGWEATLEAPVTLDYHGHTICKTGPWGQGPVMLQQLALLAGFDLDGDGPRAPTSSTP